MTRKAIIVFAAAVATATLIQAQEPAPAAGSGAKDQVAALKLALQEGLAKIRQYEWVETTVVSLKGEEKSRKQNRCYYGAEGKVQKVPVGDAPAAQPADQGGRGGRRGGRVKEHVVENKKAEITEYMQSAIKLVHSYVPPNPAQIQAAKDAGHVTVTPQPDGIVHLAIAQYQKPGDALTIDLHPAANRLLGVAVKTYLETPDDPVTLVVQMATLPDGALYAAETTLDASAKNIKVVIQNTGHKPAVR
jgi:hypothetical protein